jgi:hypothetical protein
MGFGIHRRLTQCKILNIFPTPPREKAKDAAADPSAKD